MDTKQLLERAARAAGYKVVGEANEMIAFPGDCEGGLVIRNDRGGDSAWHPGASLKDALRLAVDLGIGVDPNEVQQSTGCYETVNGELLAEEYWHKHPDKYQATCMAVVRAAAEIGGKDE